MILEILIWIGSLVAIFACIFGMAYCFDKICMNMMDDLEKGEKKEVKIMRVGEIIGGKK